jgi:hypothetical protein
VRRWPPDPMLHSTEQEQVNMRIAHVRQTRATPGLSSEQVGSSQFWLGGGNSSSTAPPPVDVIFEPHRSGVHRDYVKNSARMHQRWAPEGSSGMG